MSAPTPIRRSTRTATVAASARSSVTPAPASRTAASRRTPSVAASVAPSVVAGEASRVERGASRSYGGPSARLQVVDEATNAMKSFAEVREQGMRKSPASYQSLDAWVHEQIEIHGRPPRPAAQFFYFMEHDMLHKITRIFSKFCWFLLCCLIVWSIYSLATGNKLVPQLVYVRNGSVSATPAWKSIISSPTDIEQRLSALESQAVDQRVKLTQHKEQVQSMVDWQQLRNDQHYKEMSYQVEKVERHASTIQSYTNTIETLTHKKQVSDSLKAYNYFSKKQGAVVIPQLTSPTNGEYITVAQRMWAFAMRLRHPPAPETVLRAWEEARECWAAANSEIGQAQVGIIMAQTIIPQAFTIEHVPKVGTLNISSAPKWVEIWIRVFSNVDKKKIEKARQAFKGTDQECSAHGNLPDDFVCVARVQYDVEAPDHIQSHTMDVDLKELDVKSEVAVVRVTENWGEEYTCIYRIRMHGELVGTWH